jgi:hypothetical protein
LNTLCKKNIQSVMDQQLNERRVNDIFTIQRGYCSFHEIEDFEISISNYVLNVLKLENTEQSNVAKRPVELMSANRPYLNVYCDAVAPHLVNSEEYPLLRVINNNVGLNEKAMLEFQNLHYYPVAKRYLTNINTYITDHFIADPLPLTHTVTLLLHFRPCPSS